MANEGDPGKPTVPPPLPQPYVIPAQLIDKWLSIPQNQTVQAPLTRHDLDQLFFGLTKNLSAHQHLEQCIVKWSNNDLIGANDALNESRRLAIEGDNAIRQFFAAIMISATK